MDIIILFIIIRKIYTTNMVMTICSSGWPWQQTVPHSIHSPPINPFCNISTASPTSAVMVCARLRWTTIMDEWWGYCVQSNGKNGQQVLIINHQQQIKIDKWERTSSFSIITGSLKNKKQDGGFQDKISEWVRMWWQKGIDALLDEMRVEPIALKKHPPTHKLWESFCVSESSSV